MNNVMTHAADILLFMASLGAATYCLVLSRRLSRLSSFDRGIGGAIAVLSAQVDEMKTALTEAKAGSDGAGHHLNDLVRQARDVAGELEMMIAACHDFAEEAIEVQSGRRDTADASAPETSPDPVAQDAPAPGIPRPDPSDRDTPDTVSEGATAPEFGTADTVSPAAEIAGDTGAAPIFGSRRGARADAPAPVFRHRAAAGA